MIHFYARRSSGGRSALSRAGQAVALALLRGYKILFSPFFTGSCRFVPSCADYSRDAIVEHGVVHGIWLTIRRLSRCHPFGSSGWDPVPPKAPRG